MAIEQIEFSLIHGTEEEYPSPYPANKEIPEWYKAMPSQAESDGVMSFLRTVKNCPPFLEAMGCGYIIPLVADISLGLDGAGTLIRRGPIWTQRRGNLVRHTEMVQYHSLSQVEGAPFQNMPVVKILNPWLVRTPPGYSTLFLPLLNRFLVPLQPLAGLVKTDIFYQNVNFPALLMINRGTTLNLPKGTPLIQAIPIRRDEFQSAIVPLDAEALEATDLATSPIPENQGKYKNTYWRKKAYR